jgi:hypothetical protein
MGGGIAQLASYGLADVYLTGSPQITFWKLVYRRHTLFAMESVQQTFDGTADFGRKSTVTISRNGDLVGAMWLEISVPDLLGYDITPAPDGGNTVDATAQGHHLYRGHYWQALAGSTYSQPVAFYDAVAAAWYAAAYVGSTTNENKRVVSVTGTTYTTTDGTTGSALLFQDELKTWPYVARTGSSVPYTYSSKANAHQLRWVNSLGHAIMQSVEIEIGGARIDKHYGEWLDIWSELTEKEEKRAGFCEMVGKYDDATYDQGWTRAQSRARTLYVPLKFCFNTTPGLYLPLVALTYHQIKYNFEFRPYLECIKSGVQVDKLTAKQGGDIMSLAACTPFADYVFLDAPERIRMAEIPHEYLVTQLQFLGDETVPSPSDPNGTRNRKYTLNFNHPVRELVWVYVSKSNYDANPVTGNRWFDYAVPGSEGEIFDEARLVLNGHDRFSARSAPYFRLIQPYEHHTRCPAKKIHCYSFSLLSPEDWQPSGQANFSRFDSAQLQFALNAALPVGRMKIFAYSFNVLRIASGLGGLAFSN